MTNDEGMTKFDAPAVTMPAADPSSDQSRRKKKAPVAASLCAKTRRQSAVTTSPWQMAASCSPEIKSIIEIGAREFGRSSAPDKRSGDIASQDLLSHLPAHHPTLRPIVLRRREYSRKDFA